MSAKTKSPSPRGRGQPPRHNCEASVKVWMTREYKDRVKASAAGENLSIQVWMEQAIEEKLRSGG